MIKAFKNFLTCLCIILYISAPAMVSASNTYVVDEAGLFTYDEVQKLENTIFHLQVTTGWKIYVATCLDTDGKSSMVYADDFLDARTAVSESGLVILIDMQHMNVWISTIGETIGYLTDSYLDSIIDSGYDELAVGKYCESMLKMLSKTEYYYGVAKKSHVGERVNKVAILIAFFFLSMATGFIYNRHYTKKYCIEGQKYVYEYSKYGKVNLTTEFDHFLREHTTTRKIQTSSSSSHSRSSHSGRSSTHRSSSGRTHGGRGRSF